MDDQNTPIEPATETPAQAQESAPTSIEPEYGQPNGSTPVDLPPEAPESPINASSDTPVKDQNPPINQPESNAPEEPISASNEPEAPVDDQPISEPVQPTPVQSEPVSAPTPLTPTAPQAQSSAQQNQTSFIRALLAKANAKLGSNRQKKLDKVILLTQKKGFITNEQAQDLLHCSDATATRYLGKLVAQGRLNRTDGSHWVKYIFVR
jgi:hypothetical protein